MHPPASDGTDSAPPAARSPRQKPPPGAGDVHAQANPARDRLQTKDTATTASEAGLLQVDTSRIHPSQRSDVEKGSPVAGIPVPAGLCQAEGNCEDFLVDGHVDGQAEPKSERPAQPKTGRPGDGDGDSDSDEEGDAKGPGHGDGLSRCCCRSCSTCKFLWPWRDGWQAMPPTGGAGSGSGGSGNVAGGPSNSTGGSWACCAASVLGQGTMVRAVSLIFAWYFFSMSLSL